MTLDQLARLLSKLCDLRDWLNATDPGTLDVIVVEAVIDRITLEYGRLMLEGAK